jgi:hypothetical protein
MLPEPAPTRIPSIEESFRVPAELSATPESHVEEAETFNIHRLLHVVRHYRYVIVMSMVSLAIVYGVIAITYYLVSPAERLTFQHFRVDFKGAESETYPNGERFSPTEIISAPVLLKTYQDNQLSRYLSFEDFSHSVFVLVSNLEYEKLVADYQARLSDPKLTVVDRERVQKEFELKRDSVAKNEFSINFSRSIGSSHRVPEAVVGKVLADVLNNWADFAINQQHILNYDVSVLSPEVLRPTPVEETDVVAAIQALRSKAIRVTTNIEQIRRLPAANLVRTGNDHISLEEASLRIEDMVRFRLDPLVAFACSSGLRNSAQTVSFLENQLAYDQREFEDQQRQVDARRDALLMYEDPRTKEMQSTASTPGQRPENRGGQAGPEGVTAQLSDSFLDRVLTMAGRSSDLQYRQKLVADYLSAMNATLPSQQAVAYDKHILEEVRKARPAYDASAEQRTRAEIASSRQELLGLVVNVNALYQTICRNMTPSTQLFTVVGPTATSAQNGVSLKNLALIGLVVLLIGLPIIFLLCLVHDLIREDDEKEPLSAFDHSV